MAPMLSMDEWLGDDVPSGEQSTADGAVDGAFTIPTGTLVEDQYRIVGRLGTGSMGTVFLAHDETLDRSVAIKFARPDLIDAAFRARFLAEARAMARVNHPNVVAVYAFGEYERVPYFVMEYVQGGNLQQWLDASSMLPGTDLAFRILDDLCRGVAAIHAAHTIHQDIKPDNILLDEELRPRVADLGLAVVHRLGQPSAPELVGTPAYMAPEVAFPRSLDPALRPRADVYSLACVAYQLLTGHPPFDGNGNMGMFLQHAIRPVVPPSSLRPDLPAEVDEALLRALEKSPAARTATVEDFRRDLAHARRTLRGRTRVSSRRADAECGVPPSGVVARERIGTDVERVLAREARVAETLAAAG